MYTQQEFKWRGRQNYCLSTGRLDKLKRVDLVVDAFRRMPDLTSPADRLQLRI